LILLNLLNDFSGSISRNGYSELLTRFPHESSEAEEVHVDPVVLDGLDGHRWLRWLNNRGSYLNWLIEMNDSSWLSFLLGCIDFKWLLVVDSWASPELFGFIAALSTEVVGSTLDVPSMLEGVSFRFFQFGSLYIKSKRSSKAAKSMIDGLGLIGSRIIGFLISEEAARGADLLGDRIFHFFTCRSLIESKRIANVVGS